MTSCHSTLGHVLSFPTCQISFREKSGDEPSYCFAGCQIKRCPLIINDAFAITQKHGSFVAGGQTFNWYYPGTLEDASSTTGHFDYVLPTAAGTERFTAGPFATFPTNNYGGPTAIANPPTTGLRFEYKQHSNPVATTDIASIVAAITAGTKTNVPRIIFGTRATLDCSKGYKVKPIGPSSLACVGRTWEPGRRWNPEVGVQCGELRNLTKEFVYRNFTRNSEEAACIDDC
jgi:hypothetical protein